MAAAGDARRSRRVPLEVLSDTIQPFPSFLGIFDSAFKASPHANRQHAPTRAADAGADGPAVTQPLT